MQDERGWHTDPRLRLVLFVVLAILVVFVADLVSRTDPEKHRNKIRNEYGLDGLSGCIRCLEDRDPEVCALAVESLRHLLGERSRLKRRDAIRAFPKGGGERPHAKELAESAQTIKDLADVLRDAAASRDPEVCSVARTCLLEIGIEFTPARDGPGSAVDLIRIVRTSSDPRVRMDAGRLLCGLAGVDSARLTPAWVDGFDAALASSDAGRRDDAVALLLALGEDAPALLGVASNRLVALLLPLLHGKSDLETRPLFRFLVASAEPAVLQALQDSDPAIRGTAARAFLACAKISTGTATRLLTAGNVSNAQVRECAVRALGRATELERPSAAAALLVALQDADPRVQAVALDSMERVFPGPVAVPEVLPFLAGSDAAKRKSAARALAHIRTDLACSLHRHRWLLRPQGSGGHTEVFPNEAAPAGAVPFAEIARPHIAGLRAALKDPEPVVRREAARALGWSGTEAREAELELVGMLKGDANADVREKAADALAGIGAEAAASRAALIEAVKADPAERVRSHAFLAFEAVGSPPAERVAFLASQARAGKSEPERDLARQRLGRCGKPGFQALEEIMSGSPASGRVQAVANALRQLDPREQDGVAVLISYLGDPESRLRATAGDCLGKAGPIAAEAVPALLARLTDPEPAVRNAAGKSLPAIAPGSQAHLGVLWEASRDRLGHVRSTAIECLRKIPNLPLEPVMDALRSSDAAARQWAMEVVAEVGAPGREVAPLLIPLLEGADGRVRRAAARAAGALAPPADGLTAPVCALLRDPEIGIRLAAIRALTNLAPDAALAVPALAALLDDSDCSGAAFVALEAIGAPAIAPLAGMLEHDDSGVRVRAARALERFGLAAREAVGPLIRAVNDRDEAVRMAAVQAVGQLGPAGRQAIHTLQGVAADPHASPPLRSLAKQVLFRLSH